MEDLRIIKTKKALYSALIELMKNKEFEEIKVSDICNIALVNRSTFYAHYNDKYELLVELINNLKNNLLAALDSNKHIVNTKEYYMEMIKLIFEHIDSEKDIYYSIILSNRNSIITDIIIDVAIKDINKRLEINNIHKGDIPTDIIVNFYLGALTGLGIGWLKDKDKYNKEEILNYIDKLLPDNIIK